MRTKWLVMVLGLKDSLGTRKEVSILKVLASTREVFVVYLCLMYRYWHYFVKQNITEQLYITPKPSRKFSKWSTSSMWGRHGGSACGGSATLFAAKTLAYSCSLDFEPVLKHSNSFFYVYRISGNKVNTHWRGSGEWNFQMLRNIIRKRFSWLTQFLRKIDTFS